MLIHYSKIYKIMATLKEKAASAAVSVVTGICGVNAIGSAQRIGNIDDQMKRDPNYSYSLTLDDASESLSSAERDLNYSTGNTKIGDVNIPYTNYPNGESAWNDLNNAIAKLSEEPKIKDEIASTEDAIPQQKEIKVFNGQPSGEHTFDVIKARLEQIRGELGVISSGKKEGVTDLQHQKDSETDKLWLLLLATFAGPIGASIYTASKAEKNKI
jgi:hypothetical protein